MASELNALASLVDRVWTFTTGLQDGWYKGKAEVAKFRDKVSLLSARHDQWSDQLRRYVDLAKESHLSRLVKAADDELKKQEKYVTELQKTPLLRVWRRAFPGNLTYVLDKLVEAVDAAPKLLAERVANNDLLDRYRKQTRAHLRFGQDKNYVPISGSISKIQRALEDPNGLRVVTIYGVPGIGKSCAAKHLAVHYNEMKQPGMDPSSSNTNPFPDGVFYLSCGQEAQNRVKHLLEILAFGTGSESQPSDSAGVGVQAGESLSQRSYQMKLPNCLAGQKVLIVVDNLSKTEDLEELLVPAVGVKYLVTSQNRDVWSGAEKIKLEQPTLEEATKILANFTHGLPTRGKFPDNIRTFTDSIIEGLYYHPLSLAKVGIGISSSRATDASYWRTVQDNPLAHLDENEFQSPPGYDKPYNLAVRASMLFMLDCLPVENQRLLYLLALLRDSTMPEALVKFFYKFIEPTDDFISKYNSSENYLEVRSLLEVRKYKEKVMVATHGLRTRYIREEKIGGVRSVASRLVQAANNPCDREQIQSGDADQTLVTILSAMYFEKSFRDVVATSMENQVKIINGGVIPWTFNGGSECVNLVDFTRDLRDELRDLVGLVNGDPRASLQEQEAHECAKKIIIKFVCQGELDDNNVAHLLQLPETTLVACKALQSILRFLKFDVLDKNIMFSSTHSETMKTLSSLFHDDATSVERRAAVFKTLLHVLHNEREDDIFSVTQKVKELLATDSNPLQIAIANTLRAAFSYIRVDSLLILTPS